MMYHYWWDPLSSTLSLSPFCPINSYILVLGKDSSARGHNAKPLHVFVFLTLEIPIKI